MKVKLDETYSIEGDCHNWILSKKVRDRDIQVNFFTTLENLLVSFIELKCRTSNVKSIQELLDYQKSVVTGLNKAMQPLQFKLVRGNS